MSLQHYSDASVSQMLAEYRRTGNSRLRDRVVEEMRPLVKSVARKFAGQEPVEDLESEGFLGLLRAVDRYSPERGARFSTFAMHLVAGQIRHYLRDRGHLIRQPAWVQEVNAKVQKATAELEQKLHRAPTVAEIAAATNLTEEGVEELLAARQAAQVVRLETGHNAEDEEYMAVDPEKIASREYVTLQLPIEDRIALEGALSKLKEVEQKVLYYFFYQEFNQSEIARQLGISCNYAGYVLRNGLKHMRERLESPDRRRSGDSSSVVDGPTGIYNREQFDRRLQEEISRSQRTGLPVSVCCLRLMGSASDEDLHAAAEALRKKTRRADIVARTGPAEFGVILPETGDPAPRVAERLAQALQAVTETPVAAATATYPDYRRPGRELYAAASEAAYPQEVPALLQHALAI
jgi:RNA polymerase sigma-B factor